jgi:two-component system, cell cycle sensor histidine kinase and response regulator CckA
MAASSRGSQLTEDHFRLLVDNVRDYAIFMLDPDGLVVTWNQGAEHIKGYRPEEILGRHFSLFYTEEDILRGEPMRTLETALSQGRLEAEGWRVRKDGSKLWANVVITPLRDTSNKLIGFCKVTHDSTERMRAEAALSESEERYRLFFDSNLAASFVFTPHGELLGCNPAFTRMFGFDSTADALRHNLASLYSNPICFKELVTTITNQRSLEYYEQELRRRDGSPVYVVGGAVGTFGQNGELVQILGYFIDETARRKTEEQLRQDQKMNAVGRLAGGIAHDFNNILGIVVGCGEVLSREIKADSPLRKHLDILIEATRRGAGLTRQLLAFSRQQVLKLITLNLSTVVADIAKILPQLIGEDIELITQLEPNLGSVKGDQNQLEQIIINLAANARDAMPKGGRLLIETSNVLVSEGDFREKSMMPAGEYVLLTVSDNGIGMDEATRKQIFEPFFSTKGFGKATGLGLAIVYGIVKQSGGFISVSSEPGNGTTFKIYLPFVPELAAAPIPEQTLRENENGNETILLVEDEEQLLDITHEHLTRLGYSVLTARNGAQAIEVASQCSEPIHLLITDVIMPKLGGRELVEQLHSTHRGLPVIYVSGYTNRSIAHEGLLGPGVGFLQKPFRLRDLSRKVREILNDAAKNENTVVAKS